MSRDAKLPKNARFSCQSCGRCCRGWTVTVDSNTVEALRGHDWGGDPFVPLRGNDDGFRIKMVDGRCFFLDDAQRCRIHSELGYEHKPAGCKAFPLHFGRIGGQTHARLSYYCPTVSENKGKALRDQQRWVRETLRAAGDIEREAKLTLDDELELTLRDIDAIEKPLLALVEDSGEASAADRLAAGAALLGDLSEALEKKGKKALKDELTKLAKLTLDELAARGREGGKASRAGPVLSLFLGADGGRSALSRVGRFFSVRGFNLGVSALRSRVMGAKASWRQIRAVTFEADDEAATLLSRYLGDKLRSRRYLHGEASMVGGFNLLVAAYAVINVLSRLRAAADKRPATSTEDIRAAVQAADLLVVEHTALYHGPLFNALVETVLADPKLCASVLARLEG